MYMKMMILPQYEQGALLSLAGDDGRICIHSKRYYLASKKYCPSPSTASKVRLVDIHADTATIIVEIEVATQWYWVFDLHTPMTAVPQLEKNFDLPLGGAHISISIYL